MVGATLATGKFHDLSHLGLRASVGFMFIVHSLSKFDSNMGGFFSSIGLPSEMAPLIGLLEFIGGVLLVVGIITRISASLLAIEMLFVMVSIKKLQSFSGKNGLELELLAFVVLLTLLVLGPGRISISHVLKKLPRFVH
ncbi:DoxX family protein [Nitrosotalea sinensis]|jgi:putative oxidoreductase|uniref:DoxX family protein n=1 Tax=Nitrosotalea sinensis TaxID=1499975 RepID=A0A2H1EJ85_9ARCH|nr:DoxX family protein [Candidatus Nitrosotalea sinensis]SHO47487.1 DoxX family protein [Candidatus Nitrosotalea sinensis]